MGFLREHQLNIMLIMMGICGILPIFVLMTKTLSSKRRHALILMEIGAVLLLMFDRFAYIYRGDASSTGYYMVRVSNFVVFLMTLFVIFAFNQYLIDLLRTDGALTEVPRRLRWSRFLLAAGGVMLVISQFTGLYYTFDETNHYQRAGGYIISYMIPMLVLILQSSVIIQYFKRLTYAVRLSLLLFTMLSLLTPILQLFTYGISLTNITIGVLVVLMYVLALFDLNEALVRAANHEIEILQAEQKNMHLMFEQTASALASAIDAKDRYTHGHSRRVAQYAEKIAQLSGKNEKECEEIFFAALLHDVGKIGISEAIINKEGRLTDDEFAAIKAHPVIGKQILSSISRSPYLSIGANYHHERYDGRGYPEGLKGDDIPEIARIIAVADAYDAMTSRRSYRDPLPQPIVREEIVKGTGTQFDPKFAKIMLHLIDLDSEYEMVEREELRELDGKNELVCGEYRDQISEGILITPTAVTIRLICVQSENQRGMEHIPSLVLFDSLDGRVHDKDNQAEKTLYFDYGTLRFDGQYECMAARKMQCEINELRHRSADEQLATFETGLEYQIEAVRFDDHVRIRILCFYRQIKLIVALPDSTRYAYIGLTGTNCTLRNVDISRAKEPIADGEIPRIAERISFIEGKPVGDIPNLQVDGWRSAATKGIPVRNGMTFTFHTESLPTARLIWHCPFVDLFYSDDQTIEGENYREFALIRLDGESWDADENVDNTMYSQKTEDFVSWDDWKKQNRSGLDVTVHFERKGNTVIVTSTLAGLSVRNVTAIHDEVFAIYAALTGDQCALTNIKVHTT